MDRRQRFLRAASEWHARTRSVPAFVESARSVADAVDAVSVVLVEGPSDVAAIESLARRSSRDLVGAGVEVVPMGGATNIARFVELFGPDGLDVPIAGLVDLAEARHVRRALHIARPHPAGVATIETLALEGFFVCDVDLEDELIRALGPPAVEAIIDELGELRSFRTLQRQPAHVGRPVAQQLHRFMSSKGGRKIRYASPLVEALDPSTVPIPLRHLLDHVRRTMM